MMKMMMFSSSDLPSTIQLMNEHYPQHQPGGGQQLQNRLRWSWLSMLLSRSSSYNRPHHRQAEEQ